MDLRMRAKRARPGCIGKEARNQTRFASIGVHSRLIFLNAITCGFP